MTTARDVAFSGTLDEVQDEYHARSWTDGLPIIPPTRDRVERFLAHTSLDADVALGVLPPSQGEATVWSIAVNGVMAGCRPEYMPLLVAIVDAVCDPVFRVQDAGSTPGWEPLIIVSGPITKRLNFNSEGGVLRIGRQANSAVGRFLRLYLRNVQGMLTPPGATDKATIGMNFHVALAENDDVVSALGWPTFGQDRGFGPSDDVVTVQSVVGVSMPTYSSGDQAEEHARMITDVIGERTWAYWAWAGLWWSQFHPVLLLAPAIAEAFAKSGWTKDDLRSFIVDHARLPASAFVRYAHAVGITDFSFERMASDGRVPPSFVASNDPDRLLPIMLRAGDIGIVVAGDASRNQSKGFVQNHVQGPPISRRVGQAAGRSGSSR